MRCCFWCNRFVVEYMLLEMEIGVWRKDYDILECEVVCVGSLNSVL